jgi:hypothetical protein
MPEIWTAMCRILHIARILHIVASLTEGGFPE